MVNFSRIFQAEKKIANKIILVVHKNIQRENKYIKAFRSRVQSFFRDDIFKINDNESKEKFLFIADRIFFDWKTLINDSSNDVEKYFVDLIKTTYASLSFILPSIKKISESSVDDFYDAYVNLYDTLAIKYFLFRRWTQDRKTWQERLEEIYGSIAAENFANIFETGIKNGQGYKKITQEAKKNLAMDAIRIERIVRTEGQRISNDIILNTYEQNKNLLAGIEYTATLDVRTCVNCGALDGKQYFYKNLEDQNNVGVAPQLPLHPLCRCVYVPISAAWEKMGKNYVEKRASQFGPTTGKYADWLKEMEGETPGFAAGILKDKYEAWNNGTWQLDANNIRFTPQSTIADFLRDI